jgi:hypothetical protein
MSDSNWTCLLTLLPRNDISKRANTARRGLAGKTDPCDGDSDFVHAAEAVKARFRLPTQVRSAQALLPTLSRQGSRLE